MAASIDTLTAAINAQLEADLAAAEARSRKEVDEMTAPPQGGQAPMPPQQMGGGGQPMPPQQGGAPMPPQAPQPGGYQPGTPQMLQGGAGQVQPSMPFQNPEAVMEMERSRNPRPNVSTAGMYTRRHQGRALEKEQEFQQKAADEAYAKKAQFSKILASSTYKTAMLAHGNEDQARQMADNVLQNPEVYNDINTELMKTIETVRGEGVAKETEKRQESELSDALQSFGIDPAQSDAISGAQPGMVEAVELFMKQEDRLTKQEQALHAQEVARTNAYSTVDNTIKQINNTLGHADNFGSTGLASVFYSKIPGTEAYATLKSVDTQRAVNAFMELRLMREASKTGGALGNVSNREIELLYNAYTALDPKMGDSFQRNMVDVLQRFERVKFMLANEKRFEREKWTAEDMFNAATRHTNMQVAGKMKGSMKTPVNAINFLMDNPNTADVFQSKYGWSPISYEMDEDLSGLVGGQDYMR